jgi:hypothetical protein
MKVFIKLFFSPDGPSPLEILPKVKDLGFKPVFGNYDLVRDVEDINEYMNLVKELHESLRGTKVMYNLYSSKE